MAEPISEISKRLQELRLQMKKEGMAAYYVPTNDFHGSEYMGDYFKCREFLSGFTGSAGSLIVMEDFAGLWTDGRYFLQAEKQLSDTEIVLMKIGEPDIPKIEEFLAKRLSDKDKLGLDGRCVSKGFIDKLIKAWKPKNISIEGGMDLVDRVWKDRPELSFHPIWELTPKQSGRTRDKKLSAVRTGMAESGADAHFITCLEDIAWILNLRGNDISCNPVFLSYLYIEQDACVLFGNKGAFSEEITSRLAGDGIQILPYEEVDTFTKNLQNKKILVDENSVSWQLLQNLSSCTLIFGENPSAIEKAIKDETELSNMRKAHEKDGAAVTRFLYRMKQYGKKMAAGNLEEKPITELLAEKILEDLRKEQEGYLFQSFEPIMAYGPHGAIIHYSSSEETNAEILPGQFLLLDTGGHYMDGTTDITRTMWIGKDEDLTPEQKKHYTLVLKSHLALLYAKFPKGISGMSLDGLARGPIWAEGLDYNHGTGHGVGYLLSVHEGPNVIRSGRGKGKVDVVPFMPGMITSDEPGLYFAEKYGIRLENLMECVEEETGFLGFRPLTLAPFEKAAILPEMLNKNEKLFLNDYHKLVYDKISIYLTEDEKIWLKKETQPI